MKNKQTLIFVLLTISLIATFYLYPGLPHEIPIHWNYKGEVDGYGPKSSIFITAILPIFIYGMMLLAPLIDPKKKNYEKFGLTYSSIRLTLSLFFMGIHWVILLTVLQLITDISTMITFLLSLLFILLGNKMPKVKHNYFLGIRTPWTLADERVWNRTHRLSGYLYLVAGFISLLSILLTPTYRLMLLLVSILLATFLSIVYSYVLYTKMQGGK